VSDTQRVALVTGAARGVGEEITARLLGAGVRVVAVDRDRATLEELTGRLGDGAAALHPVVADVRFRPELEAAVTAALDVFGRIDVLVNNAGRWTVAPFVTSDPAAWDDDLAINLMGPLHLTQLVLPHMISAGWGRVVSVVSDSGRVGEPNVTVYSAAKAGLAGFSRSLAKEVGRHGITVNCVSLSPPVDGPPSTRPSSRRWSAAIPWAASASPPTPPPPCCSSLETKPAGSRARSSA
jgi:2-hydroxycyclohexanecarboxyl-CoA dehydrogenase